MSTARRSPTSICRSTPPSGSLTSPSIVSARPSSPPKSASRCRMTFCSGFPSRCAHSSSRVQRNARQTPDVRSRLQPLAAPLARFGLTGEALEQRRKGVGDLPAHHAANQPAQRAAHADALADGGLASWAGGHLAFEGKSGQGNHGGLEPERASRHDVGQLNLARALLGFHRPCGSYGEGSVERHGLNVRIPFGPGRGVRPDLPHSLRTCLGLHRALLFRHAYPSTLALRGDAPPRLRTMYTAPAT